jgi:transposase
LLTVTSAAQSDGIAAGRRETEAIDAAVVVEWLQEDHLVWTVLGAVDQMDLDRFREAYRMGAAGRAPFYPAVMVALLMYPYARGIRSSRGIERACWEDVAFKVITGLGTPDHSTIAEFPSSARA